MAHAAVGCCLAGATSCVAGEAGGALVVWGASVFIADSIVANLKAETDTERQQEEPPCFQSHSVKRDTLHFMSSTLGTRGCSPVSGCFTIDKIPFGSRGFEITSKGKRCLIPPVNADSSVGLRFPCALSLPAYAASVDLGVEWPLKGVCWDQGGFKVFSPHSSRPSCSSLPGPPDRFASRWTQPNQDQSLCFLRGPSCLWRREHHSGWVHSSRREGSQPHLRLLQSIQCRKLCRSWLSRREPCLVVPCIRDSQHHRLGW